MQQENFARAVASGMSQADAYRKSYKVKATIKQDTVYMLASRLAAQDKIATRIKEIRVDYGDNTPLTSRDEQLEKMLQLQSIAATHLQKVVKRLDADGNETEEATFNRSAADTIIKCAEVINKMCGYNEPDKVDTTLKIEFVRPALASADDDVIYDVDFEELGE